MLLFIAHIHLNIDNIMFWNWVISLFFRSLFSYAWVDSVFYFISPIKMVQVSWKQLNLTYYILNLKLFFSFLLFIYYDNSDNCRNSFGIFWKAGQHLCVMFRCCYCCFHSVLKWMKWQRAQREDLNGREIVLKKKIIAIKII